jgi:hypothetical protein
LGGPFISVDSASYWGSKPIPPLSALAEECGLVLGTSFNILEKAILLLNRGASVSCRDLLGYTVLHSVISNTRLYELPDRLAMTGSARWFISLSQPFNLLVVFITAGADVYAITDDSKTPSMLAMEYGRMEEWTSALQICGFDVQEVLSHPSPCCKDCISNHQTSQLSFEDWCQQLDYPSSDSFLRPDGSWDFGEMGDRDHDTYDDKSEDRDKDSDIRDTVDNRGKGSDNREEHSNKMEDISFGCYDKPTDILLEDNQYGAGSTGYDSG